MKHCLILLLLVSMVSISANSQMRRLERRAIGGNSSRHVGESSITYTDIVDTIGAATRNAYSLVAERYEIEDGINFGRDADYTMDCGLEFRLNIPQGRTIDTAIIYMTLNTNTGWTTGDTVDIGVYDVDTASIFVTGHTHSIATHQTMSEEIIPWTGISQTDLGSLVTSPNIKSLVQIPISRAGWLANNYIGIVLKARTPTITRKMMMFNYGGGVAEWIPSIRVVYH